MRVYLDLDGVLADFDKATNLLLGNNWRTELSSNEFWRKINSLDNFFSTIEPFWYAKELVAKLSHHDLSILTALPRPTGRLASAKEDKTLWVRKHICDKLVVNTVIGGVNKGKEYAREGYVLIDDMERNIDAWNRHHGIGVLHVNYDDTLLKLKELNLI